MAGTRSSKQNKTTPSNKGNGKKSASNQCSISMTSPPKKKMTAEEKAQARARARASMLGSAEDSKKDSSTTKKSKKAKTHPTPDATTVSTANDNKSNNNNNNNNNNQVANAAPPPHGGSRPGGIVEMPSSSGTSSPMETTADKEKPKADGTEYIKYEKEKPIATTTKTMATAEKKNVIAVSSKLKGVAKLLLIDMQSDDAKQVNTAICNLWDMLSIKNNDKPRLHPHNSIVLSNNSSGTNTKKHIQEADQLGAASILTLILQKWATCGTVQHNVCGCLVRYASVSPTARIALIKSGAIEAIVNGMTMGDGRRPSSYSLAALACLSSATSVVGGNPSSLSWEELRQAWHPFTSEYQGIDRIVQAMKSLRDTPDAIADCADILENLIVHINNNEDVKSQVRKSGAHTLIFNAVQEYPNHQRVKSHGGALVKRFL